MNNKLIIRNNIPKSTKWKELLKEFDMKDLEGMKKKLGDENKLQWDTCTLSLSQPQYIEKVLDMFNIFRKHTICHLLVTPNHLKNLSQIFKIKKAQDQSILDICHYISYLCNDLHQIRCPQAREQSINIYQIEEKNIEKL